MKKLLTLILAAVLACGLFAASFADNASPASGDTVLYYIPGVSQFYHADPDCHAVSMTHRPLPASFTLAEANNDAYISLKPCKACGAPKRLPVQAAAAQAAAAETTPAEQFVYTLNSDDTATITGVADKDIVNCTIPAELNGHKVTVIGLDAFENCWKLNEVTLPDTVTKIDQYAFAYSGLKSVNIPDSVTTIDNSAFTEAFNLADIRISVSHPYFAVRNNALIRKSDMTLLKYIGREKGPYEIEKGITTIGQSAFDNGNITSVVIPDSVTVIEDHAFSYTEDLKEITLPDSVVSLGMQVFFSSGITSLKIPAGLTDFGDGCLDWCFNLKNVEVDPANTAFEVRDNFLVGKKENALLYYLDDGKDTLEIPAYIEVIEDGAFTGNKSLKEIIIPDTVKEVRGEFFQCEALESIRLPQGMKSIRVLAFAHCKKLTSITIPEGVESINSNAFYDCVRLSEVTVPASVIFIEKDAFEDCSSALTIKAPAGSFAQKFCEANGINFTALN